MIKMVDATQQNTSLVKAAATAESLIAQADALINNVSVFKLEEAN